MDVFCGIMPKCQEIEVLQNTEGLKHRGALRPGSTLENICSAKGYLYGSLGSNTKAIKIRSLEKATVALYEIDNRRSNVAFIKGIEYSPQLDRAIPGLACFRPTEKVIGIC